MLGARGTRSAAIFDVDGDGDLDIVTNDFNASPMVLVSNLTEKTTVHYVAVKLTGSTSNRDGLGAVVKVTAAGSTYTKVMDGNSGYLSHSLYPLYFGLGSAQAVESIDVKWPSGKTQTVQAADQDQLVDRDQGRVGPSASARSAPGSRRWSLHRPVSDGLISGRPRSELGIELRIRGIERVRSFVDRSAQVVDLAVNERAAHAGAIRDIELVTSPC